MVAKSRDRRLLAHRPPHPAGRIRGRDRGHAVIGTSAMDDEQIRYDDGSAQGRLGLHLLDGPVSRRPRGRGIVSREEAAEVHAAAESRHAAIPSVGAGAQVQSGIDGLHAGSIQEDA
jgi:hypothetical protein